jgi:hypothetical protein
MFGAIPQHIPDKLLMHPSLIRKGYPPQQKYDYPGQLLEKRAHYIRKNLVRRLLYFLAKPAHFTFFTL